jgi:shikimate kinase
LMNVPDPRKRIEELLDIRRSFYEQADFTIPTEKKSIEQIRDEIIELVITR